MADRYWVGNSGTWDNSDTTNWSATSGGSGGQSTPTSSDNVFFDASSFSQDDVQITVPDGVTVTCRDLTSLDVTFTGNVLTGSDTSTILCQGDFTSANKLSFGQGGGGYVILGGTDNPGSHVFQSDQTTFSNVRFGGFAADHSYASYGNMYIQRNLEFADRADVSLPYSYTMTVAKLSFTGNGNISFDERDLYITPTSNEVAVDSTGFTGSVGWGTTQFHLSLTSSELTSVQWIHAGSIGEIGGMEITGSDTTTLVFTDDGQPGAVAPSTHFIAISSRTRIVFQAGYTYHLGYNPDDGNDGTIQMGGTQFHPVIFASSTPGEQYTINSDLMYNSNFTCVSDCIGDGVGIPFSGTIDNGNNVNWVFTPAVAQLVSQVIPGHRYRMSFQAGIIEGGILVYQGNNCVYDTQD